MPLLHIFFGIADLTVVFRSCVSRVRFVIKVRVFFAPAAQRGLCPHALRAPLPKGSSPLGILASVAPLDPLSVQLYACGGARVR